MFALADKPALTGSPGRTKPPTWMNGFYNFFRIGHGGEAHWIVALDKTDLPGSVFFDDPNRLLETPWEQVDSPLATILTLPYTGEIQ